MAWGEGTDGHCDSMTESAQWADSVKSLNVLQMFPISPPPELLITFELFLMLFN